MIQGIQEVIDWVNNSLAVLDRAIIVAGEGMAAEMADRIHLDGLATDGGDIGPNPNTGKVYGEEPYFTFIKRFASTGGIPQSRISSGGWVQLPDGYKSFREYSGRQTDKVDLKYTGHLFNSYRFVREDVGAYTIGFLGDGARPDSVGVQAAQKAAWLEDLYGKEIFSPTAGEYDNFFSDIAYEWRTAR